MSLPCLSWSLLKMPLPPKKVNGDKPWNLPPSRIPYPIDYPRLLMGNWKLISMALEHLGDGDGAREAQAKSEDYRQQVND